MERGILPHWVVGDMDSLPEDMLDAIRVKGVSIETFPSCKDETDGQLAVDLAIRSNAGELVLLGADGGRPDHAYGNYLIMRRAAQVGIKARMAASWGEAIVTGSRTEFSGWPGRLVSILPLCDSLRVRDTGNLAYSVGDALLRLHHTRGISNYMTAEKAWVDVASGWALIFILDRRT